MSEGKAPQTRLVIIQCDSGHLNGDLIACARHRIYDLREKGDCKEITHVLFIIHLPHHVTNSSFIGFQSDPWISYHIDDLRPTSNNAVSASEAIGLSISELFLGTIDNEDLHSGERKGRSFSDSELMQRDSEGIKLLWEDNPEKDTVEAWRKQESTEINGRETEISPSFGNDTEDQWFDIQAEPEDENTASKIKVSDEPPNDLLASHNAECLPLYVPRRAPLFRRLHSCIQAAASRLKDSTSRRSTKRVEILVHLIPKELPIIPGLYCVTSL